MTHTMHLTDEERELILEHRYQEAYRRKVNERWDRRKVQMPKEFENILRHGNCTLPKV